MAAPMVRGIVTETWDSPSAREPRPKATILELWDESTATIDALWPQITPEVVPAVAHRVRPVSRQSLRPAPLRHRQRDPSPRPGLRLPARAGHRAAAVLRAGVGPGGCASFRRARLPALAHAGALRAVLRFRIRRADLPSGLAALVLPGVRRDGLCGKHRAGGVHGRACARQLRGRASCRPPAPAARRLRPGRTGRRTHSAVGTGRDAGARTGLPGPAPAAARVVRRRHRRAVRPGLRRAGRADLAHGRHAALAGSGRGSHRRSRFDHRRALRHQHRRRHRRRAHRGLLPRARPSG